MAGKTCQLFFTRSIEEIIKFLFHIVTIKKLSNGEGEREFTAIHKGVQLH